MGYSSNCNPQISDFYEKHISSVLIFSVEKMICFNHSHFNMSFDTGGGHIYLLSPVLVTLHSAGPLSPMCIPRAEQSLSSYGFWMFHDA